MFMLFFMLKNRGNKNGFQWDAYHPLDDRIPACTGHGVYSSNHWVGGIYLGGVVCPGGCLPPGGGGVCPRGVCLPRHYVTKRMTRKLFNMQIQFFLFELVATFIQSIVC